MSQERVSVEAQVFFENSNDGLLRQVSSANTLLRCNWSAVTNPAVTNDNTQGYSLGSQWINAVDKRIWICTSTATGAAVWTETTPTASNIDGGEPTTNYGANIPIDGGTP